MLSKHVTFAEDTNFNPKDRKRMKKSRRTIKSIIKSHDDVNYIIEYIPLLIKSTYYNIEYIELIKIE
jgi:hypothetical protein